MAPHTLLKPIIAPFKLASNSLQELSYVLDMWSEVAIKRFVSPTMTVRYNNQIESELDFSIFEVLGGFDYFSLFVKLKHVFITKYKGGPKEDDVDSYDYAIKSIFIDDNGWSKVFTIQVYFFKDGGDRVISTTGIVEGLWTPSKKVFKVGLRVGKYAVKSGEKMSSNLPADVEKEYVSAFESTFGRCISF